jgi:hypothetical protein
MSVHGRLSSRNRSCRTSARPRTLALAAARRHSDNILADILFGLGAAPPPLLRAYLKQYK